MAKRIYPQSLLMAAKKSSVLEMYIYGRIGRSWSGDGVEAVDVAKALKDAGPITGIKLRINSPGGSVFEGSAIYSLLQSKGVPVDVVVDGLAASAAFTVAMAGTTISIGESAFMMLHNAWGEAVGTANDMRQTAALLDQINGVMAACYAKRSGLDLTRVGAMMDAETYLNASEAIAHGFATKLLAADTASAETAQQMIAKWDMTQFARQVPDLLRASDDTCTCPCKECMAGDCDSCSDVDCECASCDCEQEVAASVDYAMLDRRLRLAAI